MNNKLNEHLSEETLHAWLDDELSSRETASVDEHLAQCAECGALLEQSRELCATVSQILGAYDSELANAPRFDRANRPKLSLSSRVPSAPIISHIVAESQSTPLWTRAKRWAPIAAMILVFVGGASLTMVRGYHAVTNSVTDFASDFPARSSAASGTVDTRVVTGTVVGVPNHRLQGVRVVVRGTNIRAVTNSKGEFTLTGVPLGVDTIDAGGVPGFESGTVNLGTAIDAAMNVRIRLLPKVLSLNPVVITTSQPEGMINAGQCLTPVVTATSNGPPPFSKLRGRLNTPGTPQVDIIDWPSRGYTATTAMSLLVTGQLQGVVWDETNRLTITLTRADGRWKGTAHDWRGHDANRSIELKESSCALR